METKDGWSRSDKPDNANVAYLKDIQKIIEQSEDEEERSAAAAGAFESVQGREVAVASDNRCCRLLESMIPLLPMDSLLAFCKVVYAEQNIADFTGSPTGSRMSEKLLDALNDADSDDSNKMLISISQSVATRLFEFITDKFACFTARRLVDIAAGQSVSPPTNSGQFHSERRAGVQRGMAAKSGQSEEASAKPKIFEPLCKAVVSSSVTHVLATELVYHPTASPFLQALVTAKQNDNELAEKLIPLLLVSDGPTAPPRIEDVDTDEINTMIQDRTASRVVEVVVANADNKIFEALFERCFQGNMSALAFGPISNYVMQAALARVSKTPQMKTVVRELRGEILQLFTHRRGGVISAALAAALRTGTGQVELSKALSAAIRQLPLNKQGLSPALLTMDLNIVMEDFSTKKRLSTLGCVMLTSLLNFVKEASGEYVDSLLSLKPDELSKVAADPSGSRVLEAFLASNVARKVKAKLLKKLASHWATIAVTPAGNFFTEKSYAFGDMKEKEAIASNLAEHETLLSAQPRGAKLLIRCGVAAYKRSSDGWRHKIKQNADLQQEFADIFGDATTQSKGDIEAALSPMANQAPQNEIEEVRSMQPQALKDKSESKRRAQELVEDRSPGKQDGSMQTDGRKNKRRRRGEVGAAANSKWSDLQIETLEHNTTHTDRIAPISAGEERQETSKKKKRERRSKSRPEEKSCQPLINLQPHSKSEKAKNSTSKRGKQMKHGKTKARLKSDAAIGPGNLPLQVFEDKL